MRTFAFISLLTLATTAALAQEPRVIGYYAEWKKHFPVEQIPADKLTHVNYAFAIVKDARIALRDAEQARVNFPKLVALKKNHPHLRTLISVGGWADSEGFSDAALTDASRQTFAKSCADFAREHGFDGVDIDWEFPVSGGEKGNVERPEDKRNFTLLLAALRAVLEERGKTHGKTYLLTIAAHWHEQAKVPWMWNAQTRVMITYDDPESIRAKAAYAREEKLGGVMFWELEHDDEQSSLLNAVREGLFPK